MYVFTFKFRVCGNIWCFYYRPYRWNNKKKTFLTFLDISMKIIYRNHDLFNIGLLLLNLTSSFMYNCIYLKALLVFSPDFKEFQFLWAMQNYSVDKIFKIHIIHRTIYWIKIDNTKCFMFQKSKRLMYILLIKSYHYHISLT